MLNEYGLNVWQPSEGNDDDDINQSATTLDEVAGEGIGEVEDKKCVVVIDFYSNDYDAAKILIDECTDPTEVFYSHLKTICNG